VKPLVVIDRHVQLEAKQAGELELFRFVCTTCDLRGAWLEKPDVVERNAGIHIVTKHMETK
jgi:hypothetical protein